MEVLPSPTVSFLQPVSPIVTPGGTSNLKVLKCDRIDGGYECWDFRIVWLNSNGRNPKRLQSDGVNDLQ